MNLDTSSFRRSLDEEHSQNEDSDFEPFPTSMNPENANHKDLTEKQSRDSLQETNETNTASPVDEFQPFETDEPNAMEGEANHKDSPTGENELPSLTYEAEEHILEESNDFDDFGEFGEVEIEAPIATFEGDHWFENFEASVHALFGPPKDPEPLPESPLDLARILSLWDKLIEMPVLQRPDWLRSSIRHIFLVSMGLPVDLDELLPTQSNFPASSTSSSFKNILKISTSTTQLENEPSFNYTVARRLCCTTQEVLASRSPDALVEHIEMLKQYVSEATALAQYWTDKRDSSLNDKLLYETVVDDLVQLSKRLRKSAR
ncbi:DUF5102 family conserved fungal protein, associated with clathrin coated vesicle [Schizosaccharomyces osmophilus]|uniref:DUF5102 family conserved fungal protein, associated with clathrin coated vesicle n=1 Tax=Schizosaccharomyces osmophilus TaxID=2545709 RepID=A0AAE9W7R0_9SCHI|nr:DUF5102 family conserved fungal protein, associated with clathrin coated vesicle [Schizosaccharomyces osmophilus]WBW71396.1 DUF5102 family conserved fungal protein, associated with clathrin coated vesicle [Schizosaccharomyces osmophilus]